MAGRRGLRSRVETIPEPDLLPLMNITLMLILALITMSAMLPLGFLSSNAQKLASGGGASAAPKEEKEPLNLILFITESGFNFSVNGKVMMGTVADPKDPKKKTAFIPMILDKSGVLTYDYAELHKKLEEIKAMDDAEQRMTITADSAVEFDVIIQAMDASRWTNEKKPLFPLVSFAAGIVG